MISLLKLSNPAARLACNITAIKSTRRYRCVWQRVMGPIVTVTKQYCDSAWQHNNHTYRFISGLYDREVNGLLLALSNKWQRHSKAGTTWTCCKQTIKRQACKLPQMELERWSRKSYHTLLLHFAYSRQY